MTEQATKPTTVPLPQPNVPANWDDHQARLAEIQKKHHAGRREAMRCLDHEYAARVIARKPLYEWKVTCSYTRRNAKGKMQTYDESDQVIAHNEQDAWAMFCDKVGISIGPHAGDRTIKRLEKIN